MEKAKQLPEEVHGPLAQLAFNMTMFMIRNQIDMADYTQSSTLHRILEDAQALEASFDRILQRLAVKEP